MGPTICSKFRKLKKRFVYDLEVITTKWTMQLLTLDEYVVP
jgi:hypothetical protein